MTPVVGLLLFANGIAYLLINHMMPQLADVLAFQPVGLLLRPWTPITYMFVHADFGHIFFNMLALFFFGPRVESRLGIGRFVGLYLVSGLSGAALSFIDPTAAIIGASGAVFGVQLAFARYWPRDRILIWGVLPVEAWVLVLVMTGISIFGGVGRVGHVAHWAHLGGFAGAAIYLALMERLSPARRFREVSQSASRTPGLRGERAALERWGRISGAAMHEVNREELDRIRAVLAQRGLAGLTPEDRAFLERFSSK